MQAECHFSDTNFYLLINRSSNFVGLRRRKPGPEEKRGGKNLKAKFLSQVSVMERNGGGVCREFLRGECNRGSSCKFSHVSPKEGEGGAAGDMKSGVCRDFLRNECDRGSRCIYEHPAGQKGTSKAVKFCHNFQNGRCRSQDCSYLHCSSEEEEYYKETGKLPPGLEDMVRNSSGNKVCKDFLNGKCFRPKCKFLHTDADRLGGGPPRKRPMPSWDSRDEFHPPPREERERMRSLVSMVHDLEDENVVLRHKLSRIHRQVLDLTDDNKVLLDENRRLRAQNPDALRAPPRRPEAAADIPSLDSYLRDRPPGAVPSRAAAAAAALAEGPPPRPRAPGYDADRLAAYNPEHPTPYEGRASDRYDY